MDITVSMHDALRKRPDAPDSPSGTALTVVPGLPGPKKPKQVLTNEGPRVICSPMWEPKEFRAFERLTVMVCAPDMPSRMRAHGWMRSFIEKHGKEKCDMMLAEIRRRDEAAWRAEKMGGKS